MKTYFKSIVMKSVHWDRNTEKWNSLGQLALVQEDEGKTGALELSKGWTLIGIRTDG